MGLTNAERQERRRVKRAKDLEELRKAAAKAAPKPTLSPLDAERLLRRVGELEAALAAAKAAQAAKPAQQANAELTAAHHEIARLQHEVEGLKAKSVKPVKVKLDPESEAVRQIEELRKQKKQKQQKIDALTIQVRSLMPAEVRKKVAKALHEQTTNPKKRLDALQAWNGLGLNKLGK